MNPRERYDYFVARISRVLAEVKGWLAFQPLVCRFINNECYKSLTKLLNVAKPLELWGVNDFHQQWMKLNVPVDGIIEQLCGHHQDVSMKF